MTPRSALLLLLLAAPLVSAAQSETEPPLLAARRGFQTRLLRKEAMGEAAERPPAGVLQLVSYPAPLGKNAAYVGPVRADGKKRPAIIWLVGGFSNSIGDIAWTPGPRKNDQSASAFREHGIFMMYPSLRGGNDSPGYIETFFGEVDDVLAAAKYLAGRDDVDASRIYLGGHSTGGTLALLVAAAAGDRFRAVFALGPADDVVGYGADVLPFDLRDPKEGQLRAPRRWLKDIRCPTFVIEGTKGNIDSLQAMERQSRNPAVRFFPMPGETHFTIIAPLVEEIGRAIAADGPSVARFKFEPGAARQP